MDVQESGGGGGAGEKEALRRCFAIIGSTVTRKRISEHPKEWAPFDRYNDIIPLPYETRYKLRTPDLKRDYLNANWVGGRRSYIATQAPTMDTVGDFWLMVMETRARSIFMLTRFVEAGKIKADTYFPQGDAGGTPAYYPIRSAAAEGTSSVFGPPIGYIKVECTWKQQTEYATLRRIRVTRISPDEDERTVNDPPPHELLHVYYEGWPDAGVPARVSDLAALVSMPDAQGKESAPVVVHCSAGIGRTGVFLLVRIALDRGMRAGDPQAFCELLGQLRASGRFSLVGTPDQMVFAYETLGSLAPGAPPSQLPKPIGFEQTNTYEGPPLCGFCGVRTARFRCLHRCATMRMNPQTAYCSQRCCSQHCFAERYAM